MFCSRPKLNVFFLLYGVKAAGECSVLQNPKLSSDVCVTTGMCLSTRVAMGGTGGPAPPPVTAGAPQMKILQMGLYASDLAPLCSV